MMEVQIECKDFTLEQRLVFYAVVIPEISDVIQRYMPLLLHGTDEVEKKEEEK